MTFMRRPRVFISYRHEEQRGLFGAQRYNEQHRTWVNDFARALASWNVDVVWDERLQGLFKPHCSDPAMLPFLAEVTTLCLQVTQTFMPIVTRGYVERAIAEPRSAGYGTVTEEWRHGVSECTMGRAGLIAIIREWPMPDYSEVPEPISQENAWDFRFVAATRSEVEFLCDSLHGLWEVERPLFDLPFSDWISKYLQFCVDAFGLAWPGIERWGCNFERPRIFLEHQASLKAANPVLADAGRQRDLREDAAAMQYKTVPFDPDRHTDNAHDPERDEKAKDMMQSIMRTHIDSFRKPFDFHLKSPGGRASSGLYFGPTLRSFSYLHPIDPARAELPDQ
ncbi:MAG: hypothetical protein WBX25_17545 [Rhodomicrobium sp.]